MAHIVPQIDAPRNPCYNAAFPNLLSESEIALSRASGPQTQIKILSEGIVDLISAGELDERLRAAETEKRPLRVKYGADPSSPDLHLGHTVPLRKLRQFQDLGHLVVFIIGDFTARIGDPAQRSETRKMLPAEEVKKNAETYRKQIFKILEHAKTEVRYNSEWLDKMKPADFLHLTGQYTVARLLERDDFLRRYKSGQPIALVEFLYPLLQGYDSVMVRSDIELGGTDQKFNLLVGRELQKAWNQKPQIVMTLPLIEGTDGIQKMSKSFGNAIPIPDSAEEMFGKIMSIPDALMTKYFRYATGAGPDEIREFVTGLESGKIHPRKAKADLAERIVSFFHSTKAAGEASRKFDRLFKDKAPPEDMPEVKFAQKSLELVSLLKEAGLVESRSAARRLIEQGGVKIGREKVTDASKIIDLTTPIVVQCGKRKFARVFHGS